MATTDLRDRAEVCRGWVDAALTDCEEVIEDLETALKHAPDFTTRSQLTKAIAAQRGVMGTLRMVVT